MIIYEDPRYIKATYEAEKGYILFDWVDFLIPLEDIKVLHAKALDIVINKQCPYYIAETSKVTTVLRPEVIEWWADIWVPKIAEAGTKAIITVVPTTAIAAMSTHSWQVQVVAGIVMQNAKTLAEAEAVIKKLKEEA
jgi:hypothetical protein